MESRFVGGKNPAGYRPRKEKKPQIIFSDGRGYASNLSETARHLWSIQLSRRSEAAQSSESSGVSVSFVAMAVTIEPVRCAFVDCQSNVSSLVSN